MKKIWMRVGMEVEMTDEFYDALLSANKEDNESLKELIGCLIDDAKLSGETYTPPDLLGYDNPKEEICVEF